MSVAIAACGKKGPPLAPVVRLPAVVQRVTAARHGRDVYVTLTIPAVNVDRTTPVDLGYVDVYAYTGATAPPRLTFLDQATRIARVPVAAAPLAGQPAPVPGTDVSASAGATVTIVDPEGQPADPAARRFYLAVPFSTRNRPGPQHTPVEVRFPPLPPPPGSIQVRYTESAITVTWVPTTMPGADTPRVNVYREARQATPATTPVWRAAVPVPLNAAPLREAPFTESVTFGVETCYALRSVVGEGAAAVESEPSPSTCVTPMDTFPPAAPTQLVAVATAGAISLLWEANAESDLAGYLVLRGAVGDARLQPLTPAPISAVRFVDRTVVTGMRYVYAVVAVDRQMPTPNLSSESVRVEEVAQ